MPISGNAEPGTFSGQQQVQQQPSINFYSAIPIKKRRFPIIRSPSPSQEEKISSSEDHESQNKKESKIPDGEMSSLIEAKNTSSPGNSDVSKTSASVVKKEVTLGNFELGRANVEIFASRPHEAKPTVSLNPVDVLGNKLDILSKEKTSDREVKVSETANVKQEIFSELKLSTGFMSVELSLGANESIISSLEHKKTEAICHRSEKSDPSLLSLTLREEKLVQLEKSDYTVDDTGTRVRAKRTNWDLNTTMDVWEGSTNSDAFSHMHADVVGGFGNTDSCDDEKSSLTTTETVGVSLNEGKHMSDVRSSNSSNATMRPRQQCKTDDSLGLRLALPRRELDARKEHLYLSDNLVSTTASRNLGSVKTEFVNNDNLETASQSSVSPDKFVNCSRSMKPEVVQKVCKSEDSTLCHSVSRLPQNQESCASSSSSLLVPLMPHNSSSLTMLPTFSEITPSENLLNHFKNSFQSKNLHDHIDIPGEQIARLGSVRQNGKNLRPCSIGNSSVVDLDKHKLARVDEETVELCLHGEEAADDDEKINISAEVIEEEFFKSDWESRGNGSIDPLMDTGESLCDKEDEEYEDGEVREPLHCSAREEDVGKKMDNLEFIRCGSRDLQCFDLSVDQDISASDFVGEDSVLRSREGTYSDQNKDRISICCMPNRDDNSLQKVSDEVLEVGVDEKGTVSVSPDKPLDLSGKKDVEENTREEISSERPINVNCSGIAVELEDAVTDEVVKENCSGEISLTLSMVEAHLNDHDHDVAKDSSNAGNSSCSINVSCASVLTSPCKTKSVPNRLRTTQSGKEMCSDLDGEIQPCGNRDEIYRGGGGSSKFARDRAHDQSFRNSRPSFMLGRGRISGRYGSLHGVWDPDHDFAPEACYGPSDYRAIRRKHTSDVEIECNGYNIQEGGTALGSNNRRKQMNDGFRPGDRDRPSNRGNQTLRRFPRNMSPNRSNGEYAVGLRHGDKFMRHLSDDDIINPVYNHPPQAMYDGLDGQFVRGNQNFSTMQRKGYPRNLSKSPVRSRTRSPGPWSSPQHRSPSLYNRMGRMRSPGRACFRDEMVSRRRGSPSYVARHPNDLRDVDVHHPRSANSNRRSSPERVFRRSCRRTDALDSDGDDYMNKFHGDGNTDERRKFVERRGPIRSFRLTYNDDGENFRFHPNDGPSRPPYRFCSDGDTEFVERGNMREREFDGPVKHHQPLVMSKRVRNVEEQEDGNYRPVERVWHDDGFTEGRMKRRF